MEKSCINCVNCNTHTDICESCREYIYFMPVMPKPCETCRHFRESMESISHCAKNCDSNHGGWEPIPKETPSKKESDPTGKSQHDPGAKLDDGKPPIARIKKFYLALCEVARLDAYGAKHYSERGWKKVPDAINRYDNAEGRHWFKEDLEDMDSDSGFPHDVAVAWNAIVKLQLRLEAKDDDRSDNNSSNIHGK
jgi:Domain of unknown function (DUF5664)